MIWITILSFILLHIACGCTCMTIIAKSYHTKLDFGLPDMLIFIVFGPLLVLVYAFCSFYLWIDNKIKKRNEWKTKV